MNKTHQWQNFTVTNTPTGIDYDPEAVALTYFDSNQHTWYSMNLPNHQSFDRKVCLMLDFSAIQ